MARPLLLGLFLCCCLANSSAAARSLLVSPNRPTSDQSTIANSPSPSTQEIGRDFTANAPSSAGDGRSATSNPPPPTKSEKDGGVAAAPRAEEASELGQEHPGHRASSNPVGGDVIIGGLATAFLAAIVCYIRVTRRRDDEEKV